MFIDHLFMFRSVLNSVHILSHVLLMETDESDMSLFINENYMFLRI